LTLRQVSFSYFPDKKKYTFECIDTLKIDITKI